MFKPLSLMTPTFVWNLTESDFTSFESKDLRLFSLKSCSSSIHPSGFTKIKFEVKSLDFNGMETLQ